MKLTEKSVFGSILLALAAVVVLWYMTAALEKIPSDNIMEEGNTAGQDEQTQKENSDPQRSLDPLERVEEYPVGNPPAGLPNETKDPKEINPTL